MARFNFDGVDTFQADLGKLARLSDEEKFSIIRPGAELLAEAWRNKMLKLFEQRSGDLLKSITLKEIIRNTMPTIRITFKGYHSSNYRGIRKSKKDHSIFNPDELTANAEIAYILEHGSPRIDATHWMEYTNEEQRDEILASQEAEWDNLLKSKGL